MVKMEAGASWEIPTTITGINRTLYFYQGDQIKTEGYEILQEHSLDLFADKEISIQNGNSEGHFLFLQGKPINEPVAQQGPFVMNTYQEINEAIMEYRNTEFGGWPWGSLDHTHDKSKGRFALHANGREEIK